jgi:site-specific recombinase XerD
VKTMNKQQCYERAMAANTIRKREYWLDRYDKYIRKENKPHLEKIKKVRKIDDILSERKKNETPTDNSNTNSMPV